MNLPIGRVVADRAGLIIALVGSIAAGGAWRWAGTPGGTLLWALVLTVACAGYGRALAGLGGPRSFGMAAVSGLAVVLVGSTVLARLGLLPPIVQLVIVVVGVIANAGVSRAVGLPRAPVCLTVLIGACVLIGIRVFGGQLWLADGLNHSVAVKQLWDTAGIAGLAHQAGAQLVGESYFALLGGPITAGGFDGGLCAALLLLLLASELAARDDGFGPWLFVVLLVPIVLHLDYVVLTARWSGTVFLVAMFVALDRAITDRRTGWTVLPLAAALVAVRYEFALLAAPYAIAAMVLPHGDRSHGLAQALRASSPRSRVLVVVAWLAVLLALGGLRGALIGLGVTAASLAAVRLVVPLLSTFTWRSSLAVAIFAAVMLALGFMLRVVPPAAHGRAALAVVMWGTTFAVILLIERNVLARTSSAPRLRTLPTAVVLVVVVLTLTLLPNYDSRRWRLRERYTAMLLRFQAIRIEGYDHSRERAARALQEHAPAGAAIGFWGASGSGLDFARNPIRDVSWHRDRFLVRLAPAKLAGLEYLMVQAVEPPIDRRAVDDWGALVAPPIVDIAPQLRLVATLDSLALYQIVR